MVVMVDNVPASNHHCDMIVRGLLYVIGVFFVLKLMLNDYKFSYLTGNTATFNSVPCTCR